MTPAARERVRVRVPLLLVSAAAWILLVADPGGIAMPAGCIMPMPHGMGSGIGSSASHALRMAFSSPASLAVSWSLMFAAMMAPMLIAPVRHVRDRSFAHRRTRAITLCIAGYATIWTAAWVMLLVLAALLALAASPLLAALPVSMSLPVLPVWAQAIRLVDPELSTPIVLAATAALVWQFSPAKQRCLNRCHAHGELAAFGAAADLDALRFGATHGLWCAGSCWALMLLPLLISRGHIIAMAAVALWLCAERLETPMPPRWRWRIPGTAARIAVAWTRTRLQPVR
jgi:predicted metal-binding membrane protein